MQYKAESKPINIYTVLLFGLTPFIVTPYLDESYFIGKSFYVALVTIIFAIITVLIQKTYKLSTKDVNCIISFVLLSQTISLICSVDIERSLLGDKHAPEGYFILAIYLVIFYIFYTSPKPSILSFEIVLLIVSTISIIGVLEFIGAIPKIESIMHLSEQSSVNLSTIGNRNFVGTFCSLFLPIAIGLYLFFGSRKAFVSICLINPFLLISQTRSAYISFFAYIIIFFFLSIGKKDRRIKFLWVAIAAVTSFIILNFISGNIVYERLILLIKDIMNLESDSAGSNRMFIWKNTLPYIKNYFLFGVGPDNFGHIFKSFGSSIELYYLKIHNEIFQMLMTLGIFYVMGYVILVIRGFYLFFRYGKKDKLFEIIAVALTSYLIQANFNISVVNNAIVFWALLGMINNKRIIEIGTGGRKVEI